MKKHEIIQESLIKMGGPGSGHHGHAGVPGKRGGSAPSGGGGGMLGSYNISGQGSELYKEIGARIKRTSKGSSGIGAGAGPEGYGTTISKKLEGFLEEVRRIEGISPFKVKDIDNALMLGFINEDTLGSIIDTAREAAGVKESFHRY